MLLVLESGLDFNLGEILSLSEEDCQKNFFNFEDLTII